MLSSPGVIAIDDEQVHLTGLANSLNRLGVACLQIRFGADIDEIKPCPHVRVIFADLHLGVGTPSDHNTDFSTIGGLLEDSIKPAGPYFIVLWTKYPGQARALQHFLERLQGVTRPFAVLALAKADHLDDEGKVRDEQELIAAIAALTETLPQIGALFHWESRVLEAAGSTMSSLLELASVQEADKRAKEVGKILARMGIEAVGEAHMAGDHFHAVNEALLPILADRIADLRSDEGDDLIWRVALDDADSSQRLSAAQAAKLNRLVHVADARNTDGSERGGVIPLPEPFRGDFAGSFGIDEMDAAQHQFRCRDFAPDDCRFRWVLVQVQAACDHAQSHPGPVPCYLGLDFPDANRRSGTPPASLWRSPPFELNDEVRLLCISARFPVSMPRGLAHAARPIYRLREQILNDLIYHLHSHGARPGMISFRGR